MGKIKSNWISKVSIPLWDDWKRIEAEAEKQYAKFQFHYGMIGRKQATIQQRLKQRVSIPLWDDWKLLVGIISLSNHIVSIPLWDDWKNIATRVKPINIYVSIPLWDDWKKQATIQQRLKQRVSIPLWDDWKPLSIRLEKGTNKFQFHYGMIGRLI